MLLSHEDKVINTISQFFGNCFKTQRKNVKKFAQFFEGAIHFHRSHAKPDTLTYSFKKKTSTVIGFL